MQQQFYQPSFGGQPPMMQPMGQGMNNFPIQGQPENVTQSGITYNQLRQDLANFIAQNQNNDALANTLAQVCANAPMNNWLSGKMDRLVNTLGMTIDFVWNQHGRAIDLNQVYGEAINEVYNCAWANTYNEQPQLQSDPTVQQKMQQIQYWANFANQRYQQFQQAGLLTNHAPVQTNVWNTQAGQFRGFNQPNYGQPQQSGYRPTGYQQPIGGVLGQQNTGQFTTMSREAIQQHNERYVTPYNPAYPTAHQDYTRRKETLREDQDGRIAKIIKQSKEADNGVTRDKYGFPVYDETKDITSDKYLPYGPQQEYHSPLENHNEYSDISDINQVPESEKLIAKLHEVAYPHELYQAQSGRMPVKGDVESYGTYRLKPTVVTDSQLHGSTAASYEAGQRMMSEFRSQLQANQSSSSVSEVVVNHQTLEDVFAEWKAEETQAKPKSDENGLLEDEVRYLTDAERQKMFRDGVPFELPYTVPVTARPAFFALHAVLTKAGKVRQIITRLGEDMKRSVHDDILSPLRNDIIVKRDTNAHKAIMSTYTKTSLGGVVYDRFEQSKVVLKEGLELASKEEPGTPAYREKVDEAFEKYEAQIEVDIENDYNGLSAHRAANPPEEGEEDDFIADYILDEKERAARRKVAEKVIQLKDGGPIRLSGLNELSSVKATDELATLEPNWEDKIVVAPCSITQIIKTFNTPKQREAVDEHLTPFYWPDKVEDKEEQNKLTGEYFANLLKGLVEILPVDIWERLNSQGTDLVNQHLKYTVGVEVSIDSFAYDYPELGAYLATTFNDRDNIAVSFAMLDSFVALGMQSLKITDYITAEAIQGLDLIDELAIEQTNNFLVARYPTTAKANGITSDVVHITPESDESNFLLLKELVLDALATRTTRLKYDIPMTQGVYLHFAEGKVYQVYMRLGDKPQAKTFDDLVKTITLVRVQTWL